jgi:hypothetical protein
MGGRHKLPPALQLRISWLLFTTPHPLHPSPFLFQAPMSSGRPMAIGFCLGQSTITGGLGTASPRTRLVGAVILESSSLWLLGRGQLPKGARTKRPIAGFQTGRECNGSTCALSPARLSMRISGCKSLLTVECGLTRGEDPEKGARGHDVRAARTFSVFLTVPAACHSGF